MTPENATLYVIATPIGNLEDMTARAIEILGQVDLIAAEDTRHSKPLLDHFGIDTALRAYHDFSTGSAIAALVAELQAGRSLALISDAGTPLISDPGYSLVKAVREAGFDVIPVPGASALTAALSVAGIATDRFCFEGFLPARTGSRKNRLALLQAEQRTLVFYESPHRIKDSISDFAAVFGADRRIFVGRELTKKFETHFHGSLDDCLHWLAADNNQQRGEFVLVVSGCSNDELEADRLKAALDWVERLRAEMSTRKAVSLASEITGARKNSLYDAVLKAGQQK
jgi:16S rRNA (cytidine1402-2'-O)-methyltransferase